MIDVQGIFEGLIEFFEVAPNGSRNQFVNALVSHDIATADDANFWIDKFLEIGDGMGLIASADFDVLMAKRRDVGLAKATNGARAIYDKLVQLVDFQIQELQDKLDLARQGLVDVEAKIPLVAAGRTWIVANAPGSAAQKAAVLEALDSGASSMEATRVLLERLVTKLEEKIENLGGVPT